MGFNPPRHLIQYKPLHSDTTSRHCSLMKFILISALVHPAHVGQLGQIKVYSVYRQDKSYHVKGSGK